MRIIASAGDGQVRWYILGHRGESGKQILYSLIPLHAPDEQEAARSATSARDAQRLSGLYWKDRAMRDDRTSAGYGADRGEFR
jgi:hypothetical protein